MRTAWEEVISQFLNSLPFLSHHKDEEAPGLTVFAGFVDVRGRACATHTHTHTYLIILQKYLEFDTNKLHT